MKDSDTPHWSAEDLSKIAEQTLVLIERIRAAEVCMEDSEYIYFNVIADVLEDCDELPSVAELAKKLEAVQNDSGDPLNLDGLDSESPYKTDTPEESHILECLTRHRIHGGEVLYDTDGAHYDYNSKPPRAARIIETLSDQVRSCETLSAMVDMLLDNVDAFADLHDAYLEVIKKHDLDVVRSKSHWHAGKSVSEIVDETRTPIDLSASLDNHSLSYLLDEIIWKLQASGEREAIVKFDDFFSRVPVAFFTDARELYAELSALMSERDEFEAWILDRAGEGIFRTEVMAEIDRRWAGSDIARRIGRTTLDRIENQGTIKRSKKQGKLHFVRAM